MRGLHVSSNSWCFCVVDDSRCPVVKSSQVFVVLLCHSI